MSRQQDLSEGQPGMSRGVGLAAFYLSTFTYAFAPVVLVAMIQYGEAHLYRGKNPVSACNVLFVGSLATGLVTWFFIVSILATVASFLPARNASKLTVREVLAYE